MEILALHASHINAPHQKQPQDGHHGHLPRRVPQGLRDRCQIATNKR